MIAMMAKSATIPITIPTIAPVLSPTDALEHSLRSNEKRMATLLSVYDGSWMSFSHVSFGVSRKLVVVNLVGRPPQYPLKVITVSGEVTSVVGTFTTRFPSN
jgi:hypothetical protein